jgi:superfamily I DNA and RNA helicase
LQVFGAQARVAHDALQDFGMEDFRGVKGNGSPLAFGILVDHVAAALARHRKTQLFQYGTDFARSQAWELGY